MIFLGFGKYARADKIYALEPITGEERGHGRRTLVWVDGITEPIVADSSGRFGVSGTHTREHGGPIREDEKADTHPARFVGSTDGRTMRMTVTLMDSNQDVGGDRFSRAESAQLCKYLRSMNILVAQPFSKTCKTNDFYDRFDP